MVYLCTMNPFVFGKIVKERDFCPRDELVAELTGCIESGQNVVLFGRRRVGKSSLVMRTGANVPKRLLFCVDLFFTKDAAMFLEYCSNALFAFQDQRKGLLDGVMRALRRLRPRLEIDEQTGLPALAVGVAKRDDTSVLHTIDDFFEFLGQTFSKSDLVVCFDEFQSVLKYPDPDVFLAKVRSKIQYHDSPYIFTGSDRSGLKSIFTRPQSPFYKSIRPLEVTSIPRTDFQPFLQQKFSLGKRVLSAPVWDEVFGLDVPGDIQQLCAAIWESSSSGDSIGSGVLEEAFDRVMSQEIEGFRSLLGSLTSLQLRVLKVIAEKGEADLYSLDSQNEIGASSSSIRRSLTALQDKWMLVKSENGIYFTNPFLRQFLIRRHI